MLIRFIVKNLFSFKDYTEFNMLPGRSTRMPHHLYEASGTSLLKLNAMYGANGAGKSNLIKSIAILKEFVVKGKLPIELITETFKFEPDSKNKDIYLGVEFVKGGIPYYYGITFNQGIVIEEELQISGLGKKDDIVLFLRKDSPTANDLQLTFHKDVQDDKEASVFPSFLIDEMLKRNKPVLHYLRSRQNPVFAPYTMAFDWFASDLITIDPSTRPGGLALHLEKDENFKVFASEIMHSFKTGVKEIRVDTLPIEEFFGQDNKTEMERMVSDLKANPGKYHSIQSPIEELIFVWENNKAIAKRLQFLHDEDEGTNSFTAAEESDGTRRLLDYLPALYYAIKTPRVIIVDEIERSIHPLLVKELARKFSHDTATKGQLIFTTHESNLLDQDIFRPDEIWFAEKKADGATALCTLSEFREHHTIDIRKGYLNGRYGAIPFLGNLKDLNWDKYAETH
jgi:AAA15 family ATPase/GTPase